MHFFQQRPPLCRQPGRILFIRSRYSIPELLQRPKQRPVLCVGLQPLFDALLHGFRSLAGQVIHQILPANRMRHRRLFLD